MSIKHYKVFLYMLCILNVLDKIWSMPNFKENDKGNDDFDFILVNCEPNYSTLTEEVQA